MGISRRGLTPLVSNMNIHEQWCQILCLIFKHRWMNLEPKFLADALKVKLDEFNQGGTYVNSKGQYRYCYRCGHLNYKLCGEWQDQCKIHLTSLPWNTDNEEINMLINNKIKEVIK